MKCKHYKGKGWTFKINDTEELHLCEQCTEIMELDINCGGQKEG